MGTKPQLRISPRSATTTLPTNLAGAARAHAKGRREDMDDFNSETDSDYTSYWRDWNSPFQNLHINLAMIRVCSQLLHSLTRPASTLPASRPAAAFPASRDSPGICIFR